MRSPPGALARSRSGQLTPRSGELRHRPWRLTYAEATWTQKLTDGIEAHVRMFQDKAKVEVGVRLAQTYILPEVRTSARHRFTPMAFQ